MLAPGQSLGRYRIDAKLGQGAMGTVYRAFDPTLKREVALKVLGTEDPSEVPLLPDAEGKARFFREARAAAKLESKNVVAVYDVGEADGYAYLAMELVVGASLRGLIGNADLSIAARIAWLVDVARGLAAAHEIGLVHRDVKPENVLVTHDGVAKLADFGIVKRLPSEAAPASFRTKTGQLMGTPEYMAPEQWTGAELDGRVDQYAWGLVAYELVTGRATPLGKPPPVATPSLDPKVGAAIMRALEHDRAARFPSMTEIVTALAPFAASDAERARAADVVAAMEAIGSAPTLDIGRDHAIATGPTVELTPSETTARGSAKRAAPPPPPRTSRVIIFASAVLGTVVASGIGIAAVMIWLVPPPIAPPTVVDAAPTASITPEPVVVDASLPPSPAPASSSSPSRPIHTVGTVTVVAFGTYTEADHDEVRKVIARHRNEISSCVTQWTSDTVPWLAESRFAFTVGPTGRGELVDPAIGSTASDKHTHCMRPIAAQMQFPGPPPGASAVRIIVHVTNACDCPGKRLFPQNEICPAGTAVDCPRAHAGGTGPPKAP